MCWGSSGPVSGGRVIRLAIARCFGCEGDGWICFGLCWSCSA